MIENRHLRYFCALARMQHMTRAARELHIAQPALTQNIQQLEEDLGVQLLHRNGRRLTLTEAGKAFWIEAERSLQQFERVKVAAKRAGRGEIGQISIGFGSTAGVETMPQLVRKFKSAYPHVQVDLVEMGATSQLQALRSGQIDLAIAYALPDPELHSLELTPESLVATLSEQHPLASRESIALADLSREPFILPSKETSGTVHDAVVAECADAGFTPNPVQEVNTLQTALGLVAAGLGVAILPGSVRRLHREGVKFLPIRHTRMEVRLLVFWKRDYVSPALGNFLHCIDPDRPLP